MNLNFSETSPAAGLQLSTLDVHAAIERRQFTLHYQPLVSLATGDIAGFEALLRWLHPERGVLRPSAFMGLLDEHDSVPRVSRWALREFCGQARLLKESGLAVTPVLSMNMSGRFLQTHSHAQEFLRLLVDAGVRPDNIAVEINEREAMANLAAVSRSMDLLSQAGARIYLDNFGTGSSSIPVLAGLPISAIKIDRSLVGAFGGPNGQAILATLAGIGRNLNRRVMAVGVEDAEQVEFLKSAGCELAQGDYFAAALEVQAALWLRRVGKPDRAGAQIDSSRLRAFELFRDLSDEQVNFIARRCGQRDFAPGALIIRQGEVGNEVYLLEDGVIDVSRDSHHAVKPLVQLRAPTIFGEMAIVNPERIRTANVRALTEVRVVSIPVDALLSSFRSWPVIKDKLRQLVAARLSR